jgi:hypothetical protein
MRMILATCGVLALSQVQAETQPSTQAPTSWLATAHHSAGMTARHATNRISDGASDGAAKEPPSEDLEAALEALANGLDADSIHGTVAFLVDVYGPDGQTEQSRGFRREQAKRYIDAHPGTPGVLFIEDVIDHEALKDSAQHRLEYRETPAEYYVTGGTLNDTVFAFVDGPYPPMWRVEAEPVYTSLIYVDAQGGETYVSDSKVQQMDDLPSAVVDEMMHRQAADRSYNASQASLVEAIKQASDEDNVERLTELRQKKQQAQKAHEDEIRERRRRDTEIDRLHELNLKADSGTISPIEQIELDAHYESFERASTVTSAHNPEATDHALESCPVCRSRNIVALRSRHFTGAFQFMSNEDRSLVKVYRHGYRKAIAQFRDLRTNLSGPVFGHWTRAGMMLDPTKQ